MLNPFNIRNLITIAFCCPLFTNAQIPDSVDVSEKEIQFALKNGQTFNPSISMGLLFPLQIEVNLYSSIGQNKYYTDSFVKSNNDVVPYVYRGNFVAINNTFQGAIGINQRFAVGLEYSRTENSLRYTNVTALGSTEYRDWMSIVGVFTKWSPIRQDRRYTLTLFHTFRSLIGRKNNALNTDNQAVLSGFINSRFSYSFQLGTSVQFSQNSFGPIITNTSIFFGYRHNSESMFFFLTRYQNDFGRPGWEGSRSMISLGSSLNSGLGVQRRFSRNLSVNLFFSVPWATSEFGGYRSINVSFRYLSMKD